MLAWFLRALPHDAFPVATPRRDRARLARGARAGQQGFIRQI